MSLGGNLSCLEALEREEIGASHQGQVGIEEGEGILQTLGVVCRAQRRNSMDLLSMACGQTTKMAEVKHKGGLNLDQRDL